MKNQSSLKRFISRYIIARHDVDDVFQEAFLRAYKLEKDRDIEQPKALLFRIAKNLIFSEFSKKSRKVTDYIEDFEEPESLLKGNDLETNIIAQQKLGIFCEAVSTLPPQCRRVLLMRKMYGMSHKEISETLNISISTTEKHLVKGFRQCNSLITQRYNETDANYREISKTLYFGKGKG